MKDLRRTIAEKRKKTKIGKGVKKTKNAIAKTPKGEEETRGDDEKEKKQKRGRRRRGN